MGPTTQFTMSTPSVGVFFSPPEAPKPDSFTTSDSSHQHDSSRERSPIVNLPPFHSFLSSVNQSPLSPPVSPLVTDFKENDHTSSHQRSRSGVSDKDYELFPERSALVTGNATSPLFRPVDAIHPAEPDVIDLHMKSRLVSERKAKPTRADYELAVTFKSKVLERYMANPVRWLQQEQEYLKAYPPRFPQPPAHASTGTKRKAGDETRPVKRPRAAPKPLTEKLAVPKRVARPQPRESGADGGQPPVVKHRRKVSRATPTPREDMDYHNVKDFSPPVSTMAPGKNLKIDWKGHPLDLSNDPDRHELDDAEVQLASVLRLTAAQYLFAKRKIFERFVELSRIGKDFNKTSAQGVCKIDVNKASKLWTAFDKVGWFDKRLFSQYLH